MFSQYSRNIGDFLHDIVFSRVCKKSGNAYVARIFQYVTQSKMAEVELRDRRTVTGAFRS